MRHDGESPRMMLSCGSFQRRGCGDRAVVAARCPRAEIIVGLKGHKNCQIQDDGRQRQRRFGNDFFTLHKVCIGKLTVQKPPLCMIKPTRMQPSAHNSTTSALPERFSKTGGPVRIVHFKALAPIGVHRWPEQPPCIPHQPTHDGAGIRIRFPVAVQAAYKVRQRQIR